MEEGTALQVGVPQAPGCPTTPTHGHHQLTVLTSPLRAQIGVVGPVVPVRWALQVCRVLGRAFKKAPQHSTAPSTLKPSLACLHPSLATRPTCPPPLHACILDSSTLTASQAGLDTVKVWENRTLASPLLGIGTRMAPCGPAVHHMRRWALPSPGNTLEVSDASALPHSFLGKRATAAQGRGQMDGLGHRSPCLLAGTCSKYVSVILAQR